MLCINKYIIQYPEYTFARGSNGKDKKETTIEK
jgi:hypothetical protein